MKFQCSPLLLLLCFFFAFDSAGQEAVYLENPSFEANPQYASVPGGWRNCAFNNESPPDIHPVEGGFFQVKQRPHDGDTYLGLVVRENYTAESIGQKLSTTLNAGQCYSFSIQLCRSDMLLSPGRISQELTNYNKPVMLRIWGGLSPCGKRSLLAISPPIAHTDWKKYTFQFRPEVMLTWVAFEAYFVEGAEQAYNGNVLLDDVSAFIPLDCESMAPLLDPSELEIPKYSYRKVDVPASSQLRAFFSTHGAGGYTVSLRVVSDVEEVEGIIHDNCNRIGFVFGSHRLTDPFGIGLKEIAVNVEKFKDHVLVVGIPELGDRLNKKRIKQIKRVFREIGLPAKKYRIELVSPLEDGQWWLCGQREIWMRLGKSG